MIQERWDRLNRLFHEAIVLREEQRERFIDDACAGDLPLRDELNAVLRAARPEIDGPLHGPSRLSVNRFWPAKVDPYIGVALGKYKIVEHLGRGGFGDVYLATRDTDYHRRVAVKIMRADCLYDEPALLRFHRERQVLSDLDHPNIARLIDGGTTDDGRPYFIMEFVAGSEIVDYCRTHELDVRSRLQLFLKVTDAVDHSHQFGVIHRDLKPANILIDDKGDPKLVDFGIAKLALSPAAMSAVSQDGLLPLTPEYASPEQIHGELTNARSDIYSLGVVLYQLLTGGLPYLFKDCTPSEVIRTVCETKPQAPSATVMIRKDQRRSKDRHYLNDFDERKLKNRLRGDLDNIVLKAIHKDPERRYRSIAEFADDIRAHLEGRSVSARADSNIYRLRHFVWRNRALARVCVFVFATITTAAITSYLAWQRAESLAGTQLEQSYVTDMQQGFAAQRRGHLKESRHLVDQHLDSNVGYEWHVLKNLTKSKEPCTWNGHQGAVLELAKIPGQPRIASCGEDGTVRIWNVTTGEQERVFSVKGGALPALAVSADGKYLAAANESLFVWELATGKRLDLNRDFATNAESMAFSHDGRKLIVGVRYTGIYMLSIPDGELIFEDLHDNRFDRIAFWKDLDQILVPVTAYGGHRIVHRRTPDMKKRIAHFRHGTMRHFAVSTDQNWMVAGSIYFESINLFDIETGNLLCQLPPFGMGVRSLAISPNDQIIAAAYEDGMVRLFPVSVTHDQHEIVNVSVEVNYAQAIHADYDPMQSITFVDDHHLATAHADGVIRLWPVDIQQPTTQVSLPLDGFSHALSASRGFATVAFVNTEGALVFNSDRLSPNGWRRVPVRGEKFIDISVSQDGKFIATTCLNGDVYWVESKSNRVRRIFQTDNKVLSAVDVSPDGNRIAVSGHDKCLTLISTATMRPEKSIRLADVSTSVAFTPDGQQIAVGGLHRLVKVMRVPDLSEIRTLKLETQLSSLAWSSDGKLLACGMKNGLIALCDFPNQSVQRLFGQCQSIGSLAFSADNKTLFSTSSESALRMWHVPTARSMGSIYQSADGQFVSDVLFSTNNLLLGIRSNPLVNNSGVFRLY